MRKRLITGSALAAVAALLGMLLAACGGAEEPTAAPEATPTKAVAAQPTEAPDQPTPTPEPAGGPQYGGEYRFSTTSPRIGQDPLTGTGTGFTANWGQAYSELLRYEISPDIPGLSYIVAPDIVESWETPDDTTFIFHLRDDVTWQQADPVPQVPGLNGRTFTAHDAVYAIERLMAPGSAHRGYWTAVDTVTATDDYTLELKLKAPSAAFLSNVAFGFNKMHAREAVEAGGGDLNDGPTVGTGAWIVECEVDVECVYHRNPDFHMTDDEGNQLPYLDRRRNIIIPDSTARFIAFRGKRLDIGGGTREQEQILKDQYPEMNAYQYKTTSSWFIHFRTDQAPWSDERVRDAISLGIDPVAINNTTQGDLWWLSLAMTLPRADAYLSQEEMLEANRRDVDEAKALLEEAGYANGIDAKIWVARYAEYNITEIEIVAQQLKDIGVNVELYVHDRPVYLSDVFKRHGGFEDMAYGPQGTFTADQWLTAYYHSEGGRNSSHVNDPKLDAMIEEQSSELDVDKRVQQLIEIQRYLLDKKYQIVTRSPLSETFYWPWVKGVAFSAGGDYPAYRDEEYLWIDQALYDEMN